MKYYKVLIYSEFMSISTKIDSMYCSAKNAKEETLVYDQLVDLVANSENKDLKFKLALMCSYSYFDWNESIKYLNELLMDSPNNTKYLLLKAYVEIKWKWVISSATYIDLETCLNSIENLDFYWVRLHYMKFIYLMENPWIESKFDLLSCLFDLIEKNPLSSKTFIKWAELMKSLWYLEMAKLFTEKAKSNVVYLFPEDEWWYNYLDFDEVIKEMIDWTHIPEWNFDFIS